MLATEGTVKQFLGNGSKTLLVIGILLCIYTLTRIPEQCVVEYQQLSRAADPKWDEFRMEFSNRKFNYSLIRPVVDCGSPKLLVLIPTRTNAFRTRTSIRQSWADAELTEKLNITVKFVVGKPEDDELLADILLYEWEKLGDLILSSITDNYENLNLKMYAALQWQQAYCPGAAFVLKADDDVVLDPTRLIYWIDNKFVNETKDDSAAMIFGYRLRGSHIVRSKSKWNVPLEDLSGEVYPDYTLGMTYLLTNAAVPKLLDIAPEVRSFKFEDVLFTGLMAELADVPRYDAREHFRNSRKIREEEKCENFVPLLSSVFGYGADDIPRMYEQLRDVKCKN